MTCAFLIEDGDEFVNAAMCVAVRLGCVEYRVGQLPNVLARPNDPRRSVREAVAFGLGRGDPVAYRG